MDCRCCNHGVGSDSDYHGNSKCNIPKDNRRRGKHQKYDRLLNENGWVIIEMLICLPVLVAILFAAVQYWGVFTMYEHTENLKYRTLSQMEIDGGLTLSMKQKLIENLIDLGADPATIEVNGDIIQNGREPVLWPEEAKLEFRFIPKYFNNFGARALIGGNVGDPVTIGVKGSVISEKME